MLEMIIVVLEAKEEEKKNSNNMHVIKLWSIHFLFRYGGVGNNGDSIVSTVTIARAQEHHSGNYTCGPSNAEPDTITVHVLNGKHAKMLDPVDAS